MHVKYNCNQLCASQRTYLQQNLPVYLVNLRLHCEQGGAALCSQSWIVQHNEVVYAPTSVVKQSPFGCGQQRCHLRNMKPKAGQHKTDY